MKHLRLLLLSVLIVPLFLSCGDDEPVFSTVDKVEVTWHIDATSDLLYYAFFELEYDDDNGKSKFDYMEENADGSYELTITRTSIPSKFSFSFNASFDKAVSSTDNNVYKMGYNVWYDIVTYDKNGKKINKIDHCMPYSVNEDYCPATTSGVLKVLIPYSKEFTIDSNGEIK